MQYLPPVAMRGINDEHEEVEFCSRTTFLPDVSMLHGRVFVTAWEWGLEGVAEKAVPLIMHAVQVRVVCTSSVQIHLDRLNPIYSRHA